jgi:UPF0755 protein
MRAVLRFLAWGFAVAALLAIAVAIGGYWLLYQARLPGPLTAARTLVIPTGTGVSGIARLLAGRGVIRDPVTFTVLARLSGHGRTLKAGEYEFPAAVSEAGAFAIISSGRTVRHTLTIPEGLTSPEIIALVRAAPALTGDPGPAPPEGSLLPETYAYSYGETRREMIERMERGMKRLVAQLWRERQKDLPLATPEQAVTLASIVEKETALPQERPLIAGVYLNRLRRGMKLQADPTVVFALEHGGADKLGRPLTHADLSAGSPYNTYIVKGLPPGPIANPGRASLVAAMQPQATEDLYFVADGSGGHRFARTLSEQERNIARQRRDAAGAEPDPPPQPAGHKAEHAARPDGHARIAVTHGSHGAEAAPGHRCHSSAGHPCPR